MHGGKAIKTDRKALNNLNQLLAFAFDKIKSDATHIVKVKGLPLAQQKPDVTCLRLY